MTSPTRSKVTTFEFPDSHRLQNSHEFSRVFNGNEFRISTSAILLLAVRNNLEMNRLGIVISKKNLRRAVDRNMAKRHIRETFRHLRKDGLDIVVLVRPGLRKSANSSWPALLLSAFNNLLEKSDQAQESPGVNHLSCGHQSVDKGSLL